MPGPAPKRKAQRRRRNKEPAGFSVVSAIGQSAVKPPPEDVKWHIYAKNWWRSLKKSGQAQFYQDSDWAEAKLVAHLLSEELRRERGPRSTMMDIIFSRADNLLTTEGARRRLRIELTAPASNEGADATVSMLEEYRKELGEHVP